MLSTATPNKFEVLEKSEEIESKDQLNESDDSKRGLKRKLSGEAGAAAAAAASSTTGPEESEGKTRFKKNI